MSRTFMVGVALVLALGLTTAGYAAVVVDEQGVGFVGKGDIQDLFGWNNAQLQSNAAGLTFFFSTSVTASWECEWWTGPEKNRTHHVIEISTVAEIAQSVAFDGRANKKGQITGFNLNGFGDTVTTGDAGAIGTCAGNKTPVEGSLVTTIVDAGTLYVEFAGARFALPLPIDQAE
jgi:hypothetical protein